MRKWEKKNVEMEVKKGVRSGCWLVKLKGKDGKELKMVMREVKEFWGEENEEEEEGSW